MIINNQQTFLKLDNDRSCGNLLYGFKNCKFWQLTKRQFCWAEGSKVKYSIFVYVIMVFNIKSTAIVLKKCLGITN